MGFSLDFENQEEWGKGRAAAKGFPEVGTSPRGNSGVRRKYISTHDCCSGRRNPCPIRDWTFEMSDFDFFCLVCNGK